jgi:glucan phosphoethanolaminetransferase (alkaline phosphatase superfamily)
MNHKLAYGIFSERSVQYLDEIREEEKERVKKNKLITLLQLLILSGWIFAQYWAFTNINYHSQVNETIAQIFAFLLILAVTVFVAWLVLAPFERSLRKKLELIDRIEKHVLCRAMNEAYDEAKVGEKCKND